MNKRILFFFFLVYGFSHVPSVYAGHDDEGDFSSDYGYGQEDGDEFFPSSTDLQERNFREIDENLKKLEESSRRFSDSYTRPTTFAEESPVKPLEKGESENSETLSYWDRAKNMGKRGFHAVKSGAGKVYHVVDDNVIEPVMDYVVRPVGRGVKKAWRKMRGQESDIPSSSTEV